MTADELVQRYVQRQFCIEEARQYPHLTKCPDTIIIVDSARNGTYGCDTGCEYVRFEATVSCPHGESCDYEFGEFSDLASIIEDMRRDGLVLDE